MSAIPTIDRFVQELDKESRWYDLGVFLGVPTSELAHIEQSHGSGKGIQRCLIELFECFQSRSKPVSWEDIIDALIKMHNNHLADQLRLKYVLTDPSQHPPLPHHTNEGRSSVSESNPLVKDTGTVSETNDDIVFIDPRIANNFNKITTSFASLVLDVRNTLQRRSIPIDEIQFFLQDLRNLEPLSSEVATLERIFSRLRQYYCFLNYHVLISIVDRFLSSDMHLKQVFKDYTTQLQKFKKLAKMKDLMRLIKEQRELHGSHKVVEIKLHSYWDKITIQRFERFARVIFLESYKLHVQIRVVDGCMCVSWIVPDVYKCTDVLLNDKNLMRTLGIILLKIGDSIIYECLDEGCSILESAFLQAFELEDIRAMELLLAVGCDTNTQTYTGEVAITSAMKMKDKNGLTLLHYASMNGHDDTVRTLLEGASTVVSTMNGTTPFMFACEYGNNEVVTMLLHFGADPNVKKRNGCTPLIIACENGHSDVVELLLKDKVGVNGRLDDGSTAIYIACQNGYSGVVSILLQFGADPNLKRSNGWTPLIIACQNGHSDVVDLLLKAKVDINACNENGSTAIYIACQNGHSGVVCTLLQFGADPNLKRANGWTPLIIACQNGHSDVVELLLKAKVDINAYNKNRSTAIYIACQNGHSGVVSTLFQFGADSNVKRSNGWTPLMIACEKGHSDVVEVLLKEKVDISACNDNGSTAIYIACQNGHSRVVSTLLQFGADSNVKRSNGWTPLMIACQKGHNDVIELLLKAKVDISACNENRATAIYIACQNGHSGVVSTLLQFGADPNLKTSHGWTPLMIACHNSDSEIVELLLQANGDPNVCSKEGLTPLYLASQNGHSAIASTVWC